MLRRGERLRPADIGILASLNCTAVKIHRQPSVAIISTGDELAGMGEKIRTDQIRDVNAYVLCAEAKKYNALPSSLDIARDHLSKDHLSKVRDIFTRSLNYDLVISTGGISMGAI